MKHLSESCLVVDALGAAARRELLEEFVGQQLLPYEGLFGQVVCLRLYLQRLTPLVPLMHILTHIHPPIHPPM